MQQDKGFTLIELLVVIAIVAILSVVVILTLNPAELLRQARDSNRTADMATLKSAISLFLADGQTVLATDYETCYMTAATTNCDTYFPSTNYDATSTATSQAVNGTGWIPVDFSDISSGSPIGNLPIDPINNATYFYGYAASSTNSVFKVVANMESSRYANGGADDVESGDGGSAAALYEVGTNLSL